MIDRLLPPDQRRRRLSIALAAAVLLFVALSVRASLDDHDPRGEQASPSERAAVMKQATRWAEQAMTYTAATADADLAAVQGLMTDEMRAEYERTLPPADQRRDQATKGVKVDARVSRLDGKSASGRCPTAACAVGLMSLRDDRASVLLFVNQKATAKTTKDAVVNPTWQILRLVREDGRWLISGMEGP
jgi:hypothetical protein